MSRQSRMAEKKMTWVSWVVVSLFGTAFLGMFGVMAHRAYWTVKFDSPEWKTQFREDFPGKEKADSLPPEKRKQVVEQANKEFCPCKCGYTLAGCLKDDRSCPIRAKNLDRIGELVRQAQNLQSGDRNFFEGSVYGRVGGQKPWTARRFKNSLRPTWMAS